MFSTPSEIAAKLVAALLFACVLAMLARLPLPRVCGFQPRFRNVFMAFLVGAIAAVVWSEIVSSVRDSFIDTNVGVTLIWSAFFRWLGSLALIATALAYLLRDEDGEPIGLASATVISMLTLVMSAPIALLGFAVAALLFIPHLSR